MSTRVRKQIDFLKVLCKATPKQRKGIIEGANNELIKAICECALNCLKGNVSLSSGQKQKLARHKGKLRSLSNKKYPVAKKKVILAQKGGFLNLLIEPILSGLVSLFKK